MRSRPIPFSPPMVRAVLAGTKTQTRRVVDRRISSAALAFRNDGPSPRSGRDFWMVTYADGEGSIHCPYGQKTDRLWVREPWRTTEANDDMDAARMALLCSRAGYERPWAPIQYSDGTRVNWDMYPHCKPGRYRHARFMPRWASRITLEVTDVRIERLGEITDEDARAEGVEDRAAFLKLWHELHGDTLLATWVWVISFRRVA